VFSALAGGVPAVVLGTASGDRLVVDGLVDLSVGRLAAAAGRLAEAAPATPPS